MGDRIFVGDLQVPSNFILKLNLYIFSTKMQSTQSRWQHPLLYSVTC